MSKQQTFKQEMFNAGFDVETDQLSRKPFVKVPHKELEDLLKIMSFTEVECEVKKYPKYCIVSPK